MSFKGNLFFLFIIFISKHALAHTQGITINDNEFYINITPITEHLFDQTNQQTIDDILTTRNQWKVSKMEVPNFGFYENTLWTHFKLTKQTKENVYLHLPSSYFTSPTLYTVKNGVVIDSVFFGALINESQRDLKISSPIVQLNINQGETLDFYLKTYGTEIITIDYFLGDSKTIHERELNKYRLFYFFFGIMFCIICYIMILKISNKFFTNFLFITYTVFLTLLIAILNGFQLEFLSPYTITHHNLISSILLILLVLCVCKLTNLKKNSRTLYFSCYLIVGLAILSAIFNLLDYTRLANITIINSSLFGSILGLILGIILLLKKEKGALIIFLAFASFILGFVIFLLTIQGLFIRNTATFNATVFGSITQVLLLFVFFKTQLKIMRKSKKKAQKQALTEIQRNERLVSNQNEVLENQVKTRTLELEEKNKDIQRKNERITSGITYASYIQKANLQETSDLLKLGVDGFILYQPKEILSGDFYFFASLDDRMFFVTGDCTGHGVHGALLAITAHSILRELIFVEKLVQPAEILKRLNKAFYYTLRQGENKNQDGMDISVVMVNKVTNTLHYSGAFNPLVYVQNNELKVIKADRYSVGGFKKKLTFTQTDLDIGDGLQFFIYSDGYQDQFSGSNDSKFMSKKFRELLYNISSEQGKEQEALLKKRLQEWRGSEPQTDDILVMGVDLKGYDQS